MQVKLEKRYPKDVSAAVRADFEYIIHEGMATIERLKEKPSFMGFSINDLRLVASSFRVDPRPRE